MKMYIRRFNLTIILLAVVVCSSGPLIAQSSDAETTPAKVSVPKQGPITAAPAEAPKQKDQLPEPGASSDYVIGPEDLLNIDVFDVPELTRSARVTNDGTISLALIGRIKAAGLTTHQLSDKLAEMWGKQYLVNPQVNVFISEFHSQPISVIGAVEKPGVYELRGPRTLIEILSMAGGLAKIGTVPGRTLIVTRKSGFGDLHLVNGMSLVAQNKVEIDLRRLLYSRDEGLNIEMRAYDTISVSKADIIYVVGDVKKPGGYVMGDRAGLTVLQAVALAEGTTPTAAKKSVRIIHTAEDGSRTEIPVNLNNILNGKSQDVKLAANDILFVPGSAGKAAARRSVDAIVGTVTGMLIYGRL
jgi:polysaccharide biosynthesis/export protein